MPFLLLALQWHVPYSWDVEAFDHWSAHRPAHDFPFAAAFDERYRLVTRSFAGIYRDTGCNYPPFGVIATAGAMAAIKAAERAIGWPAPDHRQLFRVYLAAAESVCIVLLFQVLTLLRVPHPAAAAAGIYLLPSTWAAGAVWGQIDVLATAILLWAAACFLRVVLGDGPALGRDDRRVMIGVAALVLALETKPTTIFSVPGLLLLAALAVGAIAHRHGTRRAVRAASAAVAAAVALALVLERGIFVPPLGHSWIATYVWTSDAPQTSTLSMNGPNVWTLLGRPFMSSAHEPLVAFLTPRLVGDATFVAVVAALFGLQIAAVREVFGSRRRLGVGGLRRLGMDDARLCATLLVLVGLTNLAMGLLIAGTHERYMTHGFPFLLLGTLALRHVEASPRSTILLTTAVAAATIYGAVVYGVLRRAPWLHIPAAAVLLSGCFLVLAGEYISVMLAPQRRRPDVVAEPTPA